MPARPDSDELQSVAAAFGLRALDRSPLRGAWLVRTPDGPVVVKESTLSIRALRFVAAAQRHVLSRGCAAVVPCLATADGHPYAVLDGRRFVVSRWVDGRECDFADLADLARAVAALASLHVSSAGFQPPPGCPDRVRWGTLPGLFAARVAAMSAWAQAEGRSWFDECYRQEAPYYLEQARRADLLLGVSPYGLRSRSYAASGALCHHDCVDNNVLVTPDRVVRLVDFDYCLCDIPHHDLANLIARDSRRFGWKIERTRVILQAYRRVSALDSGDLAVLLALLQFPQDFWQVGLQYYAERQPWPVERFEDSLRRKIRLKGQREGYLAALAALAGVDYPWPVAQGEEPCCPPAC